MSVVSSLFFVVFYDKNFGVRCALIFQAKYFCYLVVTFKKDEADICSVNKMNLKKNLIDFCASLFIDVQWSKYFCLKKSWHLLKKSLSMKY